MRQVKKLRVFALSPSDVSEDRDSLAGIVDEINATTASDEGLVLELVTWKDVMLGIGRPEKAVLDQIGQFDILVGVMGRRFGTHTGEYENGTEEEFYTAFYRYMATASPRILFYFNCESASPPSSTAELEQMSKIVRFREIVGGEVLSRNYNSRQELSESVRQDLSKILSSWGSTAAGRERDCGSSLKASFWPVWRDACLDGHPASESIESCLCRTAEGSIEFMTISGRSIYSGGIEEMLANKPEGFTMKLLLFDWNSPHYAAKMRDERRETAEDVEAAREKARSIARQFVKRSARLQCQLQVRLYSEYPVWRLLIVDHNLAYTGYYPAGKRGYEGPMFRFESSDETGLFYPMSHYFDMLWDSAKGPLQTDDPLFELRDWSMDVQA